jgi:hypothetical protein
MAVQADRRHGQTLGIAEHLAVRRIDDLPGIQRLGFFARRQAFLQFRLGLGLPGIWDNIRIAVLGADPLHLQAGLLRDLGGDQRRLDLADADRALGSTGRHGLLQFATQGLHQAAGRLARLIGHGRLLFGTRGAGASTKHEQRQDRQGQGIRLHSLSFSCHGSLSAGKTHAAPGRRQFTGC